MLGLLFLSLGLNLILVFGTGGGGDEGPQPILTTLSKGDANQKIAVVSLSGEIDEASSLHFARLIDPIEKDPDVRALVIEIDSPGGTVTASDEIYDRVLRYKSRRQAIGRSPVVIVSMRSTATSGGYYVACAADTIFAEQTTLTGNIGVLMSRFNVSGLMQRFDVSESTIVASGADYKNMGSPFSPETPAGQTYLRGLVDQAFTRFQSVVVAGRGSKIVPKDVFNGKVFTAGEALTLGLVDQIGYPEDAYAFAAKSAGAAKPHIVRYREPSPGLLNMMVGAASAETAVPKPSAGGSMGFPINLRPETLDSWRTSRLLYR